MYKLPTNLSPTLFELPDQAVMNALDRIIVWYHQGSRDALPLHLRRCPTAELCTAGQLRTQGIPIPLLIPDSGDIPCYGVHSDQVTEVRRAGELFKVYSVAFTMPFYWQDATGRQNTALLGVLYYEKRAE